jgi:hypothetical protein
MKYAARCLLVISLPLLALFISLADAGEVRGRFLYEDRVFAATGWTGELQLLPVRGAIAAVEAVGGGQLAQGVTDESGEVSLMVPSAGVMQLQLSAQCRDGGGQFRVVNRTFQQFSVVSASVTVNTDTTSDLIEVVAPYKNGNSRSVGGAFNIFDVIHTSVQLTGQYVTITSAPMLTVVWEVGSTNGTYYSSGISPQIYLYGITTDTDEYDDAIIAHEFGHYVADHFSVDDSPGGSHALNVEYGLTLTWSEGFAHYLSSLVRDTPQHLDTYGDVDFLSFNLENVDISTESMSGISVPIGAANEMRVACALWDITDAIGDDPIDAKMGDFWIIFSQDLPNYNGSVTMESFFLGWRNRWGNRRDFPRFLDTLYGQGIFYKPDVFEPNDNVISATVLARGDMRKNMTFFESSDVDWFIIPVTPGKRYLFETEELHNGADTVLTLYDESGLVKLGENDDIGSELASRLAWTSDSTGTVRLRISHLSSTRQANYGSYNLIARMVPDFNNDGSVNGDDITPLIHHPFDFNLDSSADYLDWLEFARNHWGE